MSAWFASVSATAKALAALAAAVAVGLAFGGLLGMPAQVVSNTKDIGELKGTMTDILCILTQPEGANPLDCVQPPGE